jgi:hypothetical protein
MSLPVIALSWLASAPFSRNPTLTDPRICGSVSPITIGTVTTCRMPSGSGSRPTVSCPSSASRTAGQSPAGRPAGAESPEVASTWPVPFVTTSRLADFRGSW